MLSTSEVNLIVGYKNNDCSTVFCPSLFYFLVRVRCRRKESSRSLSHLLMSFLLASAASTLDLQSHVVLL